MVSSSVSVGVRARSWSRLTEIINDKPTDEEVTITAITA
jgi:hypothetical protein